MGCFCYPHKYLNVGYGDILRTAGHTLLPTIDGCIPTSQRSQVVTAAHAHELLSNFKGIFQKTANFTVNNGAMSWNIYPYLTVFGCIELPRVMAPWREVMSSSVTSWFKFWDESGSVKTWQTWSVYKSEYLGIPSGKCLHNYGKSPFVMGKSTISMAIFNSNVSLPEGTLINRTCSISSMVTCWWILCGG